MQEKIESYLRKSRGALCRFLRDIVRIPTVNPPGECYAECAEVLAHRLKSIGLVTRVHRVPGSVVEALLPDAKAFPRYNVIGRWNASAPRTLHLNAHYDVVPAGGRWRFGPFEPRIYRGWLYGRGSADMKGAIASLCFALEAIARTGAVPRMNIEVSFTADEETGGMLGAGYVARQLLRADYAVVLEGGSRNRIGCGHNGVLWLEGLVQGKAAHGSQPHKGVNAFEKMAALVRELERVKRRLARRKFTSPDGSVMHPPINIGGAFGPGEGAKVNTVPALASFSIDRRVIVSEGLRDAERELREVVRLAKQKIPKLRARLVRKLAIQPCFVDHQGPMPQAFARVVKAVKRVRPKFSVSHGFTDMHFFAVDRGLPAVGYGPEGRNAHGTDERVRTDDLVSTAAVYARFMTQWPGE